MAADGIGELMARADTVAGFLKGLANAHRLLILCALLERERSVGELIAATGIAQTSMSQHLARLKAEGIVGVRRQHRTLFYSVDHAAVRDIMAVLYGHFCKAG